MRLIAAIALVTVASVAIAQPAAWRARHPDLPGELLLLGSVHALRESDHPLPQRIDALVTESDQVVFELDLDEMAVMQADLSIDAALPPGQSLRSLLGPDRYAKASMQAAEHGIPLAMLDRFQPWFVAISMTALGMHNLGYRSEYGIEHHVRRRAFAEEKDILGLETLADQIAVFSSLTTEQQGLLLEQALAELNRGEETMTALVAAWTEGRMDELRDGLLAEFDRFPGLYSRLISERNEAWAERLVELVRANARSSLVVVGALHLVGEDSLTELLRARGFDVGPIH